MGTEYDSTAVYGFYFYVDDFFEKSCDYRKATTVLETRYDTKTGEEIEPAK